ncbi:hypothetical protein Cni_G24505 [Canna indica]|uniref:FAF domain-containing protein n=1 Tax=Canna indica TaxID=4628 RepID=A0AAQ3KVZ0_9LILI|nr:hypothetical protein Cni_G24505 [Canna indica]
MSVHAFMGSEDDDERRRIRNTRPSGGQGLITLDPSAKGLHQCAYGGGLETCTESLGSESCDGGATTEEVEGLEMSAASAADEGRGGEEKKSRTMEKEFPPPLRWLMMGRDGLRSRFMKAERRNGRLILTEVRIERSETFLSRRDGGRLRLHHCI